MPFEPASVAAGALAASALAALNRWWQYRRENWYTRVSAFCALLDAAAAASADQWLSQVDLSADQVQERMRIERLECAVIGLQNKIDGVFPQFAYRLHYRQRNELIGDLNELSDALTGGEFQVRGRDFDSARARLSQILSSNLIVKVQAALDKAITWKGLYNYLSQLPS